MARTGASPAAAAAAIAPPVAPEGRLLGPAPQACANTLRRTAKAVWGWPGREENGKPLA